MRACFQTALFGLALAACGFEPGSTSVDAGSQGAENLSVLVAPVPQSGREAAMDWLDRQNIDLADLKRLPVPERAARLNQAVYAFCRNGPQTGTVDDLFVDCSTACGGYAYVLRGLLEVTGVRTRYANLYNIPNQGNHTAVEVPIGDKWAFFDPTYGAYFTKTGAADGMPLSLSEIILTPPDELERKVLQTENDETDFLATPLGRLYPLEFDHKYMHLRNYQVAEAISTGHPGELLILEIEMTAEDGSATMGDFEAEDTEALQSAWLKETQAILLNDDLLDDVSFNTSQLLQGSRDTLTLITVDGLQAGQAYELDLLLMNPAPAKADLQLSSIGKSAKLGRRPLLAAEPERNLRTAPFLANEARVQFAVRNLGPVSLVHLYGVRVRPRV